MESLNFREIHRMSTQLMGAFKNITILCEKYIQLENMERNPNKMPLGNGPLPPQSYPQSFNQPPNPYIKPIQNNLIGRQDYNYSGSQGINSKPVRSDQVSSEDSQNKKQQKTEKIHEKQQSILNSHNVAQKAVSNKGTDDKKESSGSRGSENKLKKSTLSSQPSAAFLVFLNLKKDQLSKEYPHLGKNELENIMKEVWDSLNPDERKPYETQAAQQAVTKAKSYNQIAN